jgi:hypothetical protein
MGMEPFVAADDNAFGHLIGSIPDPVRNLREALAFKVGLDSRRAQAAQDQAQAAEIGQKLTREQMFQQDAAAVGSNPDAQAISSLMTKYPEFADKLKQGWDVKDKAAQQSDLTQLGEIYSAAASGNWELAKKQAQARLDADKAAGQADPSDEQFLSQVDAASTGDNEARKAVLTTIGTHLAAVSGPEHFATVYGALKGGYTLDAGATRYDDNGNVLAQSPFLKTADGGILERDGAGSGTPTGTQPGTNAPANVSPAAQAVASTLASSGLPSPVVAGFMGNFHAEGGYDGAQGDGGSASGIGQWRNERAANFQRVIGKPVTEATPAEQAQFVKYEMDHPQEAGMTVKQRDAILAAKTPAQAAALIDQYYERSSGRDRQIRMSAATAFAGGSASATSPASNSGAPPGYHVLVPGKGKDAPTGFQWTADGKLEAIKGGPADTSADAMDPQTVNFYAQQILAGTPMSTLSFGMGKAAAANRRQVMEQVAKLAGAEGLSGRDQAIQLAHYKAASANVANLEKQFGTIQGNERTALLNAEQFLQRSRELPAQTGSRILNTPIQTYLRQTNDPTVAAMDVAARTFATEYAKVVAGNPSGGGTLSDSARNEFTDIIQGNFPLKQKLAAVQQMRQDMENRTASLRANLQDAYSHLTDRAPELKGGGVAAIPKGAKIVGSYHGKRVVQLANGKRMVEQ